MAFGASVLFYEMFMDIELNHLYLSQVNLVLEVDSEEVRPGEVTEEEGVVGVVECEVRLFDDRQPKKKHFKRINLQVVLAVADPQPEALEEAEAVLHEEDVEDVEGNPEEVPEEDPT